MSPGPDHFSFEDTRMYKGLKLSKRLKELAHIESAPTSDIQL